MDAIDVRQDEVAIDSEGSIWIYRPALGWRYIVTVPGRGADPARPGLSDDSHAALSHEYEPFRVLDEAGALAIRSLLKTILEV